MHVLNNNLMILYGFKIVLLINFSIVEKETEWDLSLDSRTGLGSLELLSLSLFG